MSPVLPYRPPRHLLSLLLVAAVLGRCKEEEDDAYFGPMGPQLATVGAGNDAGRVPPFEVYTQNVYLGGDTGPLFRLDLTNIPAVLAATNAFWTQVQATAAPERMAAIV